MGKRRSNLSKRRSNLSKRRSNLSRRRSKIIRGGSSRELAAASEVGGATCWGGEAVSGAGKF